MSELLTLLKREWWEWKSAILWLIGIFSFILILTLIPIKRISDELSMKDREIFNKNLFSITIEIQNNSNINSSIIQNKIEEFENLTIQYSFNSTDSLGINNEEFIIQGKSESELNKFIELIKTDENIKITDIDKNFKPDILSGLSFGILTGFVIIQLFVLFIALFYFSDSIYKERSNNSTLYFRSLPIGDHLVLFSKLKAGSIGIIGLTTIMLIILLIYAQFAVRIVSGNFWDIISIPLNQINKVDLFIDLIIYQIVTLIWISPLILFLMLVSSIVKNRPLIIGVGLPILLSITLMVVFEQNDIILQISYIFNAIEQMFIEQNLISEISNLGTNDVNILGSFWKYLLTQRTLFSIIISGLIYFATWNFYRKNIPTN